MAAVGVGSPVLLGVLAVGGLLLVCGLVYIIQRMLPRPGVVPGAPPRADDARVPRGRGLNRMLDVRRRRNAAAAAAAVAGDEGVGAQGGEGVPVGVEDAAPAEMVEEGEGEEGREVGEGRKGKKYEEKMRMKEERKMQNEAQLQEREVKKREEEERFRKEDEQRAKEKEEERKEKEAEEARRREKEAREEEEYKAIRGGFVVEAAGTVESDVASMASKNAELVGAIRERRIARFDDLAREIFGGTVRPSDIVERIRGLEKSGTLTGVMDERGSYVYVSPEEFSHVANFITSRGRVTIEEVMGAANEVIKMPELPLTPDPPAQEEIVSS